MPRFQLDNSPCEQLLCLTHSFSCTFFVRGGRILLQVLQFLGFPPQALLRFVHIALFSGLESSICLEQLLFCLGQSLLMLERFHRLVDLFEERFLCVVYSWLGDRRPSFPTATGTVNQLADAAIRGHHVLTMSCSQRALRDIQ